MEVPIIFEPFLPSLSCLPPLAPLYDRLMITHFGSYMIAEHFFVVLARLSLMSVNSDRVYDLDPYCLHMRG